MVSLESLKKVIGKSIALGFKDVDYTHMKGKILEVKDDGEATFICLNNIVDIFNKVTIVYREDIYAIFILDDKTGEEIIKTINDNDIWIFPE